MIEAKYKREDVDDLIGRRISFRYKRVVTSGRITKTDFNKNYEMAYGVVTIEESNITFTTGIEKVDILEIDNGL